MINSDFRKKMADSWFSYLQSQICKEFEFFEKGRKKFIKRDWSKKNTRYRLTAHEKQYKGLWEEDILS